METHLTAENDAMINYVDQCNRSEGVKFKMKRHYIVTKTNDIIISDENHKPAFGKSYISGV